MTTNPMAQARGMRLRTLACALAVTLLAALAAASFGAAAARAGIADPIQSFTTSVTTDQAGAHPDATTDFEFTNTGGPFAQPLSEVRTTTIQLPPGLVGNPNAVPHCSYADFLKSTAFAANCPASSVVGTVVVNLFVGPQTLNVYNLPPTDGEAARLGFVVFGPTEIAITARSAGDFGLTNTPTPLPSSQGLGTVDGIALTLWGVPHDPSHSAQSQYTPSPGEALEPFMTNPTRCVGDGDLQSSLVVDTWDEPGTFFTSTTDTPRPSGCDQVPFNPSIKVSTSTDGTSTTATPDTPTPIRVDLSVPQNQDPNGVASSQVRDVSVTLPPGVQLSPSAANGLQACTDAQFKRGSNDMPDCPAASEIGTDEVDSPVMPGPLSGKIYLAQGTPGQPYRIFQMASGFGIVLKVEGDLTLNSQTDQITTTFSNLPEVPFNRFTLAFNGGPNAPLMTGSECGTQPLTSTITPWSGNAAANPTGSFQVVGCGASLPWTPSFTAGLSTASAGATGTFSTTVDRADGQATLRSIQLALPQGLTGYIARVPLCSAAQVAAAVTNGGTCDASSRIGSTTIAAGGGPSPVSLTGDVFLTQGYDGAPFGLLIHVDTTNQVGPFHNLGVVNVRAKINVDPTTAALTISSDDLPSILGGIPLKIRRVGITIDSPGFMRAPTSCNATRINGTLGSVESGNATAAARFQVANCAHLSFAPKLSAKMTGKNTARDHGRPGLDVVLTQGAGQADAKTVGFTLPSFLVTDTKALAKACSVAQAAANACPATSKFGTATAVTPLLRDPLAGPVYLVSQTKGLPRLEVRLAGQVALNVDGAVTTVGGRLKTTFASPDVPLSKFHLTLTGGKSSLLTTTANLCSAKARRGSVNSVAWNAKRKDVSIAVGATACTAAKPAKQKGAAYKKAAPKKSAPAGKAKATAKKAA